MAVAGIGANEQYAEVDSAPSLNNVFSSSIWFNLNALDKGDGLWSIVDKDVTSHYYFLRGGKSSAPVDSNLHFFRRAGGSEDEVVTSTEYGANAWHNGIVVNAGIADVKIYLDNGGEGADTTSLTPANLDRMAILGLRDASPGDYGDGSVAEWAVWDVAISAADRAMLALGICPLFVRPANLVTHHHLITLDYVDVVGGRTLTGAGTSGVPVKDSHPRIIFPTSQQLWFPPGAVAPPAGFVHSQAVLVG